MGHNHRYFKDTVHAGNLPTGRHLIKCERCGGLNDFDESFCSHCGHHLSFRVAAGASVGNYIIVEKIAAGGIGTVYKAHHKLLNQTAAIKFHDFFPEDHHVGRAFKQAANCLSQLKHPNIVTLYDYGFCNRRAYLAMEYVDGFTLSSIIPNMQTKHWLRRCLEYFSQLLSAIRYAHNCQYVDLNGSVKRGMLHADIKPQNILMDQSADIVKLTDFMIPDVQAFVGQEDPDFSRMSANTVIYGTPRYMAPEQWAGEATQKTDIFSIGATLYELITGLAPMNLIDKEVTPQMINPEVPLWLDRLIVKAMQHDPSMRFETVASMENVFLTNIHGEGASSIIQAEELTMGHKMVIKMGNISNISGQLFIGKFNEVVANLDNTGQTELAGALKILKEAIMRSRYLSEDKKKELVEIINQIGEESVNPRPNKTFLKMIWKGMKTTLDTIPDIARAIIAFEQILEKLKLII